MLYRRNDSGNSLQNAEILNSKFRVSTHTKCVYSQRVQLLQNQMLESKKFFIFINEEKQKRCLVNICFLIMFGDLG